MIQEDWSDGLEERRSSGRSSLPSAIVRRIGHQLTKREREKKYRNSDRKATEDEADVMKRQPKQQEMLLVRAKWKRLREQRRILGFFFFFEAFEETQLQREREREKDRIEREKWEKRVRVWVVRTAKSTNQILWFSGFVIIIFFNVYLKIKKEGGYLQKSSNGESSI